MLWDAWKMDSDEAEETQREVEKELGVLDREAVDTEEKGSVKSSTNCYCIDIIFNRYRKSNIVGARVRTRRCTMFFM